MEAIWKQMEEYEYSDNNMEEYESLFRPSFSTSLTPSAYIVSISITIRIAKCPED